ncbi:hypothetical protein KDX23_02890 [Burkholderia vietnamiensis]|uniref:hypothetical protein n=1 Tax=Burkholderia vietnamiensis TaxID=60552 RepID=UPI001B9EB958|nr:hypothetical protein [Burkholderia vietnamiensis]MBR8081686.1 hypothetical protein [Burkholderia vietnamiensis]
MNNDSNGSTHERGLFGTFTDSADGSMFVGGKTYSAAEQTAAGINAFTDRSTAELIMATTMVGPDQPGHTVDLKGVAIVGMSFLAALLMGLSLGLLGVPDLGSIVLQYFVFATVAVFLFALVKSEFNSLRMKLTVVGGLIVAQSAFAIHNLASASFTGAVSIWLIVHAVRIVIGVGVIRGRAVARLAFVAVVVISTLSMWFTVGFSAHWFYVMLFRSPLGFPSAACFTLLLYSGELRSGFK